MVVMQISLGDKIADNDNGPMEWRKYASNRTLLFGFWKTLLATGGNGYLEMLSNKLVGSYE